MPSLKPDIRQLRPDLYLVPLPVPLSGFAGFINAWIYTGGPVIVVDVGPTVSAGYLLEALAQIGIRNLDFILLTHIHLDHAGGAGVLAKAFPDTPVVCHPQGAPHLIDPQRLWEASLKTLGDTAEAYQPMQAVPAAQVVTVDKLGGRADFRAVETPGHASHHCSFLIHDLLFAGEAGGVCIDPGSSGLYMRPATPPRFFLDTHLESIDRLAALKPQSICYGHIGMQAQAVTLLNQHRDQLLRWHDLIAPLHQGVSSGYETDGFNAVYRLLMAQDPMLAQFPTFDTLAQARERYFILNSIRGFWGYLDHLEECRSASSN